MAKFRLEDQDVVVADEFGDLTYDDAVNAIVEEAVASIEEALWNMVDDLEYVTGEEADSPTDYNAEEAEEAPEDEE